MNLKGKQINNCYKITRKIEENNLFTIWKAEGLFSPLKFSLKFLNKEDKEYSREEYLRFEKSILSIYKINHPNLKRVFEIEKYEEHTYVAMEYIEGESLYNYLNKKNKLQYKEAIWIINEVCKGLESATRYGVIHKNLNPHHILLGLENDKIKSVKISNFGFAEFDYFKRSSEGELINRFGYLPPESFGYLNCVMDERSDLYSLGVIFYKLLTGQMFVKGNDIDAIFRDILLAKPVKLPDEIKKDMPPSAVKILKKLLNCRLEDRYQSTIGLLTDMERLNQGEEDFDLGIEDETFNPTFETKLINREKELSTLKKMFTDTAGSKGGFCLIEGDFGSGKSKLLEEFNEYVYKNNGIVFKGDFKSNSNKIPYQGFKEIINNYLSYYKKLDKLKIKKIDDILLKYVDENNIILKLFQSLSYVIKKLDKFSITKNGVFTNNYINTFSNFFCSLPNDDKNIVMILDNLQYADDDSLLLLNEILNNIKDKRLLMIATYVNFNEEPNSLFTEITEKKLVKKVKLDNFSTDNISTLTLNILNEKSVEIPKKIINFIHTKSDGNPFYAKEAIRYLISEEVIYPVIDNWECDLKRLDKADNFDVKDIILKRLQLLRSDELNILTIISILDVEVGLGRLERTSGYYPENILSIVDDLAFQKLLCKKHTFEGTKVTMHEIVKSVLLNKLYEGKIKNMNFNIGMKLEEDFIEDRVDAHSITDETFIITDNFLKSDNKDKSIEYSIKSGMVGKDTFAYMEAIKYFTMAKKLIEPIKAEEEWRLKFIEENINELKELLKK